MTARPEFAVTWDYRCPFARNGHEHILDGLEAGAPWEVTFVPFFLNQSHVPEGGTSRLGRPGPAGRPRRPGRRRRRAGTGSPTTSWPCTAPCSPPATMKAATCGIVAVVREALTRAGADADAVLAEVEDGWPAKVVRDEHDRVVGQLEVFGVPTFMADGSAVFVRLMSRPEGDGTAGPGDHRRGSGPDPPAPRPERVQAHPPHPLIAACRGVSPRPARPTPRSTPSSPSAVPNGAPQKSVVPMSARWRT